MARKRASLQAQLDALVGRFNASEERANASEKWANASETWANASEKWANTYEERANASEKWANTYEERVNALADELKASREFTRSIAHVQMLHTYLDIINLAQEQESNPKRKGRLMHPRNTADLQDEANRFAAMLADHKRRGDALDAKERLFLDVFGKIDELCASCIGNLQARK